MKKIILVPLMGSLLFGCTTGYHKMWINGGFEDFKVSSDTYMVSFKANGYTGRDTAYKYALRRCAELTHEKGFRYFVITSSSSTVKKSYYRTPLTANTTTDATASVYGGPYNAFGNMQSSSTTIYSGGQIVPVQRPITYLQIRMTNSKSSGAIDSQVILENFKK